MQTIRQLLETNFNRWGDRPYLFENGTSHSFAAVLADVQALAAYLQDRGLTGQAIGIYGMNCVAWMVADLAVMGYVGVSVAIDRARTACELTRIQEKVGLRCLIYTPSQAAEVAKLDCGDSLLLLSTEDFPEILGKGRQLLLNSPVFPEKDLDACSKIVFSSGTTSTPKAVMLSQRNMLMGFDGLNRRAPMTEADSCLLFLPLHHTYAGICNFLFSLRSGISIFLCTDVSQLQSFLMQVSPTLLSVVPLILERFYSAIPEAQRVAMQALLDAGEPLPPAIVCTVRELFGGRIRHVFCGGVKLSPEVKRFFLAAGLDVLEAYALSETASIFSIQYSGDRDLQSVGTVFEEIEVKIDQPNESGVGELLVRGDNVFLGYYGDNSATKAAFTSDGFFRTGDLGRLGDAGKVYLAGRKKRLILLSNGENVSPEELETLLCAQAGVSRARVRYEAPHIHAQLYLTKAVDPILIIAAVNAKLPKFARIGSWEAMPEDVSNRTK